MNHKLSLTLISLVLLFASCSKSNEEKQDQGLFSFSINTHSNTKASSEYSLDNVTKLLITIKQDDKILDDFNNKEITVNNWGNGNYTSESITLTIGSDYQLSKFELMNSDNTIIYAAPYENSDLADQVDTPLPIDFDIFKDETSEINVEVLSTEEKSPSDFGYVSFNVIDKTDSSDPLVGNWTKREEYPGAGRAGAVSFTIGENVYVGLGYTDGDYFSSFYKYDVTTGWSAATPLPEEAPLRRNAVAFSVDGKGYVGLGTNEDNDRLGDFWEFDPQTEVWSKMEGDKMFPGTARQGAVAFAFDKDGDGINDVAYVGTGYGFLDGDDRNYLKDFYKFENGVWSENTTYSGSKTSEATTFVIGTKGYLISGTNNLDNVWEFDAITETWTQKNDIDNDNDAENVQRTKATAFVIDGLGYITTGTGAYTREVWEYNPTKDDWVEKNSLENEIYSRIDGIGFSIDGKGFIATGTYGTTGLSDMWEFQPGVAEDDDDND